MNIEETIIKWAKVNQFHCALEGKQGHLKPNSDLSRLIRFGVRQYITDMRNIYHYPNITQTMIMGIITRYDTEITPEQFMEYCIQLECDPGCHHQQLHVGSGRCTTEHHCQDEYCIPLDDNELKGEYFRCLIEGRVK
jgi:hypothetical protein